MDKGINDAKKERINNHRLIAILFAIINTPLIEEYTKSVATHGKRMLAYTPVIRHDSPKIKSKRLGKIKNNNKHTGIIPNPIYSIVFFKIGRQLPVFT